MDYSILIAGAQTGEKTAWKSADQRFFRREFTEDSAAFPYYMSAEGDAAAQRMKVKDFNSQSTKLAYFAKEKK